MAETIQQLEVDGEAVQQVMFDCLMPALEDVPIGLAITSMQAFSVLLMKPDIAPEDLAEVLKEVSQFMVMMLVGISEGPTAPSEVN